MHATQTIARQEGMLAFYKGWLPSVIGVVPYVGLNFAVYETLKVRRPVTYSTCCTPSAAECMLTWHAARMTPHRT